MARNSHIYSIALGWETTLRKRLWGEQLDSIFCQTNSAKLANCKTNTTKMKQPRRPTLTFTILSHQTLECGEDLGRVGEGENDQIVWYEENLSIKNYENAKKN